MPTVSDLARLENLVSRLTPLTEKRRGELIEAGDWNELTGALLELARMTLGEGASDAVPVHEHPDQVDVGWLTPKLRTLVTEGGLGDPSSEAELGRLDRQLQRLGDRLEAVVQRLDRLQGDIKTVETKDITRQADLTRFSRRLDGAFDARDDVASLRSSLRGLETNVRTAVDLSRRLQDDDGEAIDFGDLAGRVGGLEQIRDSLTMPSGQLMNAAEYERRLEELRASLVTEEELDEALDSVRGSFQDDLSASILEEARNVARATLDESLGGLRDELSGRIDERLAGLDDVIDSRIEPATADLRAEILAAAREERAAELDGALGDLRDTVTAERDARIEALAARVEEDLGAQREAITAELDGRIDERVGQATAGIDQRLGQNEERMASLERASQANAAATKENGTALAATRREMAAADASLREDYVARINKIESGLDARIDERLSGLRTDLRASLQADLETMTRNLETRLNESIRRSVSTEVSLATNRLRNEVGGMVEAELAGVRAGLDETIAARVDAVTGRVNGLVADEVRRSLATLDQRIKREVEAQRTVIGRDIRDPRRG